MTRTFFAVLTVVASVLAPAAPATAQACNVTEFPGADQAQTSPSAQGLIEAMPDGNLWFGEGSSIARVQVRAPFAITKFATSPPGTTNDITAGPDGNYWFTEIIGDKIGRISPRPPYAMAEFRLPTPGSVPDAIVSGPDGNLWFTEWANRIGRIDPRAPGHMDEFEVPSSEGIVHKLVRGRDGSLWYTRPFGNVIGRIVLHGRRGAPTITEFPARTPVGLTVGADGALWFTEFYPAGIARFDTRHLRVTADYALPSSSAFPADVTVGPDRALWFTELGANAIGRLALRHSKAVLSECPVPDTPYFIASGRDGNLWFTEFHDPGIKIGRLRP